MQLIKGKQVGFTGTEKGMTDMQKVSVMRLVDIHSPGVFHHGCCVGADAEFHELADRVGNLIVKHPPVDEKKIASCRTKLAQGLVLEAKPYLVRNHEIVDASDIMIAAPHEFEEVLRSGTWATLRYAKTSRRPLFHVEPDGAVVKFNLPDDYEIWPRKKKGDLT